LIWLVGAATLVVGLLIGYPLGFGQGSMEARIQAHDLMLLAEARRKRSAATEWQH
jgi:hypothetical protein